jgi:hypothetical protein
MSKRTHFHCLRCGENFYADVLSAEEQAEYERTPTLWPYSLPEVRKHIP